mgnify:CR=1 FL=1
MLNIEKYKDDIRNNPQTDMTCIVHDGILHLDCIVNCGECKKNALKWLLEEYKEPILNEAERKYLSDVIRPFRKRVVYICKMPGANGREYILISTEGNDNASLPYFPGNTMYRGMECLKHYTLQELEL